MNMATTGKTMKVFEELLKHPIFNHILDVPRKISPDTVEWMAEELKILAGKLAAHFSADMSDASIKKAMRN